MLKKILTSVLALALVVSILFCNVETASASTYYSGNLWVYTGWSGKLKVSKHPTVRSSNLKYVKVTKSKDGKYWVIKPLKKTKSLKSGFVKLTVYTYDKSLKKVYAEAYKVFVVSKAEAITYGVSDYLDKTGVLQLWVDTIADSYQPKQK